MTALSEAALTILSIVAAGSLVEAVRKRQSSTMLAQDIINIRYVPLSTQTAPNTLFFNRYNTLLSRELSPEWYPKAVATLADLVTATNKFNALTGSRYEWHILDIARTKAQALANAKKGVGIANSLHITGNAIDLSVKGINLIPFNSSAWQPLEILRAACKRQDLRCGLLWSGNSYQPDKGHYYDPGHIENKPYQASLENRWFERQPPGTRRIVL